MTTPSSFRHRQLTRRTGQKGRRMNGQSRTNSTYALLFRAVLLTKHLTHAYSIKQMLTYTNDPASY